MTVEPGQWYPIASIDDLASGPVYQTRLGGEGLALWRGEDGTINLWEDRCPHRGVRFSLGEVVGDALVCRYHAWRFANGSGACTHIPAQPGAKPAAVLRARVWPVLAVAGLVWTGIAPAGAPEVSGGTVLRPIPVNRPAAVVGAAIGAVPGVDLVVQPFDAGTSVIRGWANGLDLPAADAAIEALRRQLEAAPC